MIDVEQRGLEIGLDSVRAQQPLDRPDQGVLARRCCVVSLSSLEIAEGRHELRQWNRLGRAPLERDGPRQPALRRLDLCECVERIDVARPNRERDPIVPFRETQTAVRPEELSELRLRPRERLRLTDGGFDGEAHGIRRTRERRPSARAHTTHARRTPGSASWRPSC